MASPENPGRDKGQEQKSQDKKGPDKKGRAAERKAVLLRLDPSVHAALQRWAADDLRSVNAQIEVLLRDALRAAGRLPRDTGPLPRRGRPPGPPTTGEPAQ